MSESLCRTCKHFEHKSRGKRGALMGVCKLSRFDMGAYTKYGHLRTPGSRIKCNRYEEATNDKQ